MPLPPRLQPLLRPSFWLPILCLAGLATLYAVWVWSNALTDLGGDSATYLIISRLYSPYHSASDAALAFKSGIFSPPMFPFLLSLVDGGYHFLAAHLLVAFFAVASAVALYFWLKREDVPLPIAGSIALLFALLPATMQTALNIWSEFPALFFSMAAVALLAQTRRGQATPSATWFAAAAMVACACLTRVAALSLLGAFLLTLLIHRPRKFLLIGAVAALPFLSWAAYSALMERGAGVYAHVLASGYEGDPVTKFLIQINVEYDAVLRAWKMGWLQYSSSAELHGIVGGFLLLCVAGCLYRLVNLRFDALYALLYAIELFVWPHPEEAARYSFVLYPILIASGLLLLKALPRNISRPGGKPYLLGLGAGVAILCALPAIAYDLEIFFGPIPAEIEAARHTQDWYAGNRYYATVNAYFYRRLFGNLAEIDRIVAPDQCIFAIKPSLITLLSDRKGTALPRIVDSDATFNEGIGKCRYVYVLPFASPSFPQMFYPMERLGDRAKIVSRIDDDAGNLDGALLEITP